MSAYEGEHMIFGLLGQVNLAQNDVLQFDPFTCKCKISFFFMAAKNSIVYKYHIFLIHSSVVGHLGYFHDLAIEHPCNKHGCVGASGVTCVESLWVYPQQWDCWIIW
jgi:hypothetical protein